MLSEPPHVSLRDVFQHVIPFSLSSRTRYSYAWILSKKNTTYVCGRGDLAHTNCEAALETPNFLSISTAPPHSVAVLPESVFGSGKGNSPLFQIPAHRPCRQGSRCRLLVLSGMHGPPGRWCVWTWVRRYIILTTTRVLSAEGLVGDDC